MSALAASVVTAVVTALLAIVGTYFTTRRKLEADFDTSLRDLRIEAYKELWKDLKPLAKYDRPNALKRDEARKLAAALRTWYFDTGGLFLSLRTRQDYFALLDALETLTVRDDGERLADEDDEFLRVVGSRLRTGMTADVGTRRRFPFQEERGGAADPPKRTYAEAGGRRRLVVTRGSRRWLLFGPHRLTLEVEGIAGSPRWDPERSAFTLRGPDGERELLLERGKVVEGPKGWERGSTAPRPGGAVWNELGPD